MVLKQPNHWLAYINATTSSVDWMLFRGLVKDRRNEYIKCNSVTLVAQQPYTA
jgi:hypothetical protein